MSIGIVVDLACKPGVAGPMIEGMKQSLPHTRSEKGCEMVELYVDHDNPDHLVIAQRWTSRALYDAHAKQAMAQPGMQEMMKGFEREPAVLFLDDTGA